MFREDDAHRLRRDLPVDGRAWKIHHPGGSFPVCAAVQRGHVQPSRSQQLTREAVDFSGFAD